MPFEDVSPEFLKLASVFDQEEIATELGEWDAGDDNVSIPPRGWLLGNIFCRRFISSLIADGGVGKTALRVAQLLSLSSGRQLTGDHVFERCRVLIVSLEDDADELRRRLRAAMLHYGVAREDVRGWLFLAAPGGKGGKLMVADAKGRPRRSTLADLIEATITTRQIDVVSLDPFVKSHAVEENSNNAVDNVMQVLSDMAVEHDIAIDVPHHTNKGLTDAGNANKGRGASAMKDAARLVYTLTPMSTDEAQQFGISEAERRSLIRMDSGKVNIAPPLDKARWYRLVGVPIGNESDLYPKGDEVQTVEVWTPPDAWAGLGYDILNQILTDIDAGPGDGERYSDAASAGERGAWHVVLKHAPDKSEADARRIIKTWVQSRVLVPENYNSPSQRRERRGLRVDATKRPGTHE